MDPALSQLTSVLEQMHERVRRLETRGVNPEFEHVSEMGHNPQNPENGSDPVGRNPPNGVIRVHPVAHLKADRGLLNYDNKLDFDLKWKFEDIKDSYHGTWTVSAILLKQLDETLKGENLVRESLDYGTFTIGNHVLNLKSVHNWDTVSKIKTISVRVHPLRRGYR